MFGAALVIMVGNLQIIRDTMDKLAYLNTLKENLKQSAQKMGDLRRFPLLPR